MNILNWQKSRLVILSCCSFTILVALIFLFNKSDKYEFPKNIALQQWESINTEKITFHDKQIEGRKYQQEKNHNLDIEIYYIPSDRGENSRLIRQYLELESDPQNLTVKENKNIGSYGLFSEGNKTYLTTCIHSQGKTAFTSQQFAELANHNLNSRLFPWILGLSDLRDWSCLWVNMSVSLNNITEEKASLLLQQQLFDLVSIIKLINQ